MRWIPLVALAACAEPLTAGSPRPGEPAGGGGGPPLEPPRIAFTDASCLEIGPTRTGGWSEEQVVLANPSSRAVEVELSTSDPQVTVRPARVRVEQGRAEILTVRFTPAHTGVLRARLGATCEGCDPVFRCVEAKAAVFGLTLAPPEVELGVLEPGARTCQLVSAINTGGIPVLLRSVSATRPELDVQIIRSEIPPSQQQDALQICWAPTAEGRLQDTIAVTTSDGDVREVEVRGVCGLPVLAADPPAVDFGFSEPADTVVREVTVFNDGGPGLATLDRVEVEGDGVIAPQFMRGLDLGDGGEVVLRLARAPGVTGPFAGVLHVRVRERADHLRVPFSGEVVSAPPCLLEASSLEMGALRAGERHVRTVRIHNAGATSCPLWDLGLRGSPYFSIVGTWPDLQDLASGASIDVDVAFLAPEPGPLERAVLHVSRPGSDLDLAVSAHPVSSCVRLDPVIDLGRVQAGATAYGLASLVSCDELALRVRSIEVSGDRQLSVVASQELPHGLGAGGGVAFAVRLDGERQGPVQGTLRVALAGLDTPLVATVRAVVTLGTCSSGCSPALAICPPPQEALVGGTVPLPGGAIAGACTWSVRSAPPGSRASVSDRSACATSIRPDVAGEFLLHLAVPGTDGCETRLTAAPGTGLRVELTWSEPSDQNLHLLIPSAGDPLHAATWLSSLTCGADHLSPAWDAEGTADDPRMLREDPVGTGPEVIQIDEPVVDHAYRAGVHWLGPAPAAEVASWLRVFCSGALAFEEGLTLTAQHEAAPAIEIRMREDGTCSATFRSERLTVIP